MRWLKSKRGHGYTPSKDKEKDAAVARIIRGLQKLRAQASEHLQASTRQAIAQVAAVKAQKLAVIAQDQVTCD